MKISEVAEFQNLKETLPELPWEKRERFTKAIGLPAEIAEIFISDKVFGQFFDAVTKILGGEKELLKLASNYIASDIVGLAKSGEGIGKVTAESFASLVRMIRKGNLSSRGGKDLLAILYTEGGDPEALAKEKGLIQKSDPDALKKIVIETITANPKPVEEYKGGKEASLQFLVGQGMRASRGSANPQVLTELFKEALK
jgi:aspartyl-tRNA(Asn)/glutamyl-tRNA(Gln) amidotransferase subunit B